MTLKAAVERLKRCADELLERPVDLDAWQRLMEAFEAVTRVKRA